MMRTSFLIKAHPNRDTMASGKKYGLIIPSKKGTAITKQVDKPSIFDESSDEEDSGRFWKKDKKKPRQTENHDTVTKALAEDPSIFEYDSVYDEMQEQKKKADPRLQKKDTKPKYIYQLKKTAEKRKLEQEIVYERKVQREMESEGADFQDKDTFVTSAYRKKLEERRKMEEELLKEDAIEAANDVRKQKDLSKFHRNLLNQITASKSHSGKDEDGIATRMSDKERNRHRETQQSHHDETSNQERHQRNDGGRDHRERRHSHHSPERRHSRHSPERRHSRHSPERRHSRHSPERRHSRHSPERRHSHHSPERKHSRHSPEKIIESKSQSSTIDRSPSAVDKPQEEAVTNRAGNQGEQIDKQETEQVKTVKLPTKEDLEVKRRIVAAKRTNTEAMESAKERYLARKKAKLSIPIITQDD